MAKETFYFSHDYNARADVKTKALIKKHGMLGYGIYWAIVEDLYNNANVLPYDTDMISYDLRVNEDVVKSIINDFKLFEVNENTISSPSVAARLNRRQESSDKGRNSATQRWGTDEKRTKAIECIFYVVRIYNTSEEFIKVGITSESVSRRYSGKLNGYSYELLFQCEKSTEIALEMERKVCENYAKYNPSIKFAGHLECFGIKEKESILYFAMHGTEFRNAIKESKGKKKKVKESKDIPTQFDFLTYCYQLLEGRYAGLEFALKEKYKAWVDNDWKDGYNKPIVNWKTKIGNTIPHLKPMGNIAPKVELKSSNELDKGVDEWNRKTS